MQRPLILSIESRFQPNQVWRLSVHLHSALLVVSPTGQGWGIAYDEAENELIVTDGSFQLQFFDKDSLALKRSLPIRYRQLNDNELSKQGDDAFVPSWKGTEKEGSNQNSLNELEVIHGFLFANLWFSNDLLILDKASGEILASLDVSMLRKDQVSTMKSTEDANLKHHMRQAIGNMDNVLNGIAYDEKSDTLFLTGKLWSRIYTLPLLSLLKEQLPTFPLTLQLEKRREKESKQDL